MFYSLKFQHLIQSKVVYHYNQFWADRRHVIPKTLTWLIQDENHDQDPAVLVIKNIDIYIEATTIKSHVDSLLDRLEVEQVGLGAAAQNNKFVYLPEINAPGLNCVNVSFIFYLNISMKMRCTIVCM